MACPHLPAPGVIQSPPSNLTRPEECSQCFDNQDSPDGIDICLGCYNAGCPRLHAQAHADKFGEGHSVVINVKRVRKPVNAATSAKRLSGEPPMKKLAIREEPPEHEKYDFITTVKCYACGGVEIDGNEKTSAIVKTLLSAMTTAKQSEVKAWEQEMQPCQHTRDLVQLESKHLAESGLAHCSSCDLTQNLWLCLTCGSLSCGRQQYGGLGGNGHAVAHYQSTGHPVSVKLGTIQPDGTADIYCYACDDEKLDPKLADHLRHFGIMVESQVKTEKSLSELQVEQNMKFDFAMTGEDGKELEPLFGPGLTGLRNLGNSCYMNSVLQVLFSLPGFSDRYFTKGTAHTLMCQNTNPANCFECQMAKIADGLLSGRYSHPRAADSEVNDDATADAYAPPGSGQDATLSGKSVKDEPSVPFQEGIRPIMFKTLVGKDHPEFSTMRQQDSEEFFSYLVTLIQKTSNNEAANASMLDEDGAQDPTDTFKFKMQERLQCQECKGVRYKSVPEESVSMPVPFFKASTSSSKEAGAADNSGMDVDTKGKGTAENVEEVTTTATATPAAGKDVDSKTEYEPVQLEECLRLLTAPTKVDEYKCPKCQKNVSADKSTKFETFPDTLVVQAKKFTIVNWVPQKVDVPIIVPQDALVLDDFLGLGKQANEIDLPEEEAESSSGGTIAFNEATMSQLEAMGFPPIRCQKALLATGNSDPEAAMNWLFAHMEDPDIDAPIPAEQLQTGGGGQGSSSSAQAGLPSADAIAMVSDMGFTANQARKALKETSGNIEAAVEWLFSNPGDPGIDESTLLAAVQSSGSSGASASADSKRGSAELPAKYRLKAFISHKGNSIHVGHYVAHIYEPGVGWVLFNDEKVVKADGGAQGAEALMPFAYLYIFEQVKPEAGQ